ncbi:MBL fold metallo-hydrolase [Leifsonia sp. AG29]|uniref:MBL fold metallo-hydrolase n=1 Tax=Leifsonia sp. AG29 TaxID=2598860 RepID=UPI00131E944F|nr:MBL fold metallo-hydrolase [Leifsonia sp. AG29]
MTRTSAHAVSLTPLGGPTVLIGFAGHRFLVDPTFDPAGDYPVGSRVLTKTSDAIVSADEIGPVDAVLLSHDQHPDNLDRAGRVFAENAPLVLTTRLAAGRLRGRCRGLLPGERADVGSVTVTAVPAQHGPDGTEDKTGPVIGFVLEAPDAPTLYISGDNASLDVVRAVADRFPEIEIAILFGGAARSPLVDGFLTLTSSEAVEAAAILGHPRVLAAHTDGWAHFTQDGSSFRAAFEEAGIGPLLLDTSPGVPVHLDRSVQQG